MWAGAELVVVNQQMRVLRRILAAIDAAVFVTLTFGAFQLHRTKSRRRRRRSSRWKKVRWKLAKKNEKAKHRTDLASCCWHWLSMLAVLSSRNGRIICPAAKCSIICAVRVYVCVFNLCVEIISIREAHSKDASDTSRRHLTEFEREIKAK